MSVALLKGISAGHWHIVLLVCLEKVSVLNHLSVFEKMVFRLLACLTLSSSFLTGGGGGGGVNSISTVGLVGHCCAFVSLLFCCCSFSKTSRWAYLTGNRNQIKKVHRSLHLYEAGYKTKEEEREDLCICMSVCICLSVCVCLSHSVPFKEAS